MDQYITKIFMIYHPEGYNKKYGCQERQWDKLYQRDNKLITRQKTNALTNPAIGQLVPILMLAIVRAIEPVVAIPPNFGLMMSAIPCPIKS
jgi:hypothetical protein